MAVKDQLDRLAAFEPAPYPVVSLYLNTQPGQTGRDQFHTFVRKEFAARGKTYPAGSPERESLDKDLERISSFLDNQIEPAANGVAVFACSAGELFETVQTSAPIDEHWLYIGDQPHLYPLARIESLHPTCAVVLADTNAARIMVFATGEVVSQEEVTGVKTKRTSQGGWSQARYQRHIENFHVQHVKEVVEALEKIVQRENISEIVVAGDEVVMPLLREQMPKHLQQKVVDHVRMNSNSPREQLIGTLARRAAARAHRRRAREGRRGRQRIPLRRSRRGRSGRHARGPGQGPGRRAVDLVAPAVAAGRSVRWRHRRRPTASTQCCRNRSWNRSPPVNRPKRTRRWFASPTSWSPRRRRRRRKITFVEDAELLADYGGVAAILRFKI